MNISQSSGSTSSSASSTVDTGTLLVGIIAQAAMSAPGLVPNLAITYITFKHKNLRTISCCFLAQIALWDAISEVAFVLPMVLLLLKRTIPLLACFCVQWYDSYGLSLVQVFMLAISLDRLFAIITPIRYKFLSETHKLKIIWLTSVFTFALCYALLHFSLLYSIQNANKPVYCVTSDYIQGALQPYAVNITTAFNVATLAVYVLVWIAIKCGRQFHAGNSSKLFKSLSVITLIVFFCFTFSYLTRIFIVAQLPIDATTKALLNKLIGNLSRLAGTMNGPVLYFCSSLYRDILDNEFPWLAKAHKWAIGIGQSHNQQQHQLQQGQQPQLNAAFGGGISSSFQSTSRHNPRSLAPVA